MAGWAISPTLCLPISLDGQARPAGCAAGAGVFSFARKARPSGPSNRLGRRSCPACRRRGPLIDPSATGFYRLAARAGGRTGLDRRSRRGSIETQPWHSSFKCGGGPFLRPPRAGLIATGTVDGPAVPGSCRSGRRVCWRSDRATPHITPSEAKTWPCTGRNSGVLRNRGCGDRIPAWDTVLCRDPAELADKARRIGASFQGGGPASFLAQAHCTDRVRSSRCQPYEGGVGSDAVADRPVATVAPRFGRFCGLCRGLSRSVDADRADCGAGRRSPGCARAPHLRPQRKRPAGAGLQVLDI